MTYAVKEIFFTLQGEGAQTGRAAVFVRFAGCNLWSGREEDRSDAVCTFCDTDFVGTDGEGGGKFATARDLAEAARKAWPTDMSNAGKPLIVATGGEPALQVDAQLIETLHDAGFEVAMETNGTIAAPAGLDWLTVSPKAASELVQTSGNELKLVYPQDGNDPADFADLDFDHFFLQPKDVSPDGTACSAATKRNTDLALDYIRAHPKWRLSLQTHKLIGIP